MKTKEFLIRNAGKEIEDALAATEKLGRDSGLTAKENLRLRLLAEELLGMTRSITGGVEARYSAEETGKKFTLDLSANVEMTQELRKLLLSVSSRGENAAAKGFMGKIKDMIAAALLPDEYGVSIKTGFSLGLMSMGPYNSPAAQQVSAEALMWSMRKYKDEIDKNRAGAEEEWDELEKSIVASIADEVIVRMAGSEIGITIQKAF